MLIVQKRGEAHAEASERLVLPFNLRQKSRLRTRLASGREVGLFMERGTVLRGGDRLVSDCGVSIAVEAAPERVVTVTCASPMELARAAYHLGNRHVPLEIGAGYLRLEADPVLADMLRQLGAALVEENAPFEPEAGAYGGGHHHHDDEGHGGIIHQFQSR